MSGAFVVDTAQLLALCSTPVGGLAPEQMSRGTSASWKVFLGDFLPDHSSVLAPWEARAVPILALPDYRLLLQAGYYLGATLWAWGLQLMEQHSQSTMVTISRAPGDGGSWDPWPVPAVAAPGPSLWPLGGAGWASWWPC